jgi:hypothetical protein
MIYYAALPYIFVIREVFTSLRAVTKMMDSTRDLRTELRVGKLFLPRPPSMR